MTPITHLLEGRAELDPRHKLGQAVRWKLLQLLDAAADGERPDEALLVVLTPGVT
jgi:hypothetical protein